MRFRPHSWKALSLAAALLPLACARTLQAPEQGVYGTFIAYSPRPDDLKRNCDPLPTQAEKDTCRKHNSRPLEEPMAGTVRIRNLGTDSTRLVALDDRGSYRVKLRPGTYEVCLGEECSDPLDVSMNRFIPYGGRLPKPSPQPGAGAAAESAAP